MSTPSKARVVFLGANVNPISIGCLDALIREDRYEILVGIDRLAGGALAAFRKAWKRNGPAGALRRVRQNLLATIHDKLKFSRRRSVTARSLDELARSAGIASFPCRSINTTDANVMQTFAPDLIVVANFSQIIRRNVLAIPRLGVINFHPTLLPLYRGPMPYYWIIKNRVQRSGVTIHFLDEGIDTGDIILQVEHDVAPEDDEASLRKTSIEIGSPLLVEAVRLVLAGTATRKPQEGAGSYFGMPPRGASRL